MIKLWSFQSIVIVTSPSVEEDDFSFEICSRDLSREFPLVQYNVIGAEKLLSLSLEGIQAVFVKGHMDKSIRESLDGLNKFAAPSLCWLMPHEDVEDLKHLRLDSCVFLYETSDNQTTVTIEEVFSIKGGQNLFKSYGSWTIGGKGGVLSVNDKVWTERRRDLGGVQLSNVITDLHLHHMVTFDDTGAISGVEGLFVDILSTLADSLNFTVTHVSPRESTFGVIFSNGTATGLIGSLARREADLSAALLTSTAERKAVVDFSRTVLLDKTTLTSKKSRGRKINFLAYVGVFAWNTWLGVGLYVLILALGLLVLARRSDRSSQETIGIVDSLAIICLYLLQRDNPYEGACLRQTSIPSRILFFTTGLSSFVLFGFYTALLTSLMTVQSPAPSLEEFADVLDAGYSLIVVDNSFSYDVLASARSESKLRDIFELKIAGNPKSRLGSHEECFRTLKDSRDDKLVYFGSGLVMHQLDVHEEFVQVLDISDAIVQHIAVALVKDSEFTEMFNSQLLKMEQSGLINKYMNKWMPWIASKSYARSSGKAVAGEEEAALSLSYENVLFLFFIFLSGPVLASIIAMIEKVFSLCTGNDFFT